MVFLVIVDLLFLAGLHLMTGGMRKLTDTTWTVKLVAGCEIDYHTTIGAVALACPGVDYMRVWPLATMILLPLVLLRRRRR